MKETGLMFKAPLVRAILNGQKTQTRRIAMTELTMGRDSLLEPHRGRKHAGVYLLPEHAKEAVVLCPYGKPGDRIYVRETWAEIPRPLPLTDESLPMRKDDRIIVYKEDPDWDGARSFLAADGCIRWAKPARWSPSIHMPKHAARIWLEVTDVRVERLQSISEEDAKAEGVDAAKYLGLDRAYARAFSELWETTGGDWAANPWVWVIDFKRITHSTL